VGGGLKIGGKVGLIGLGGVIGWMEGDAVVMVRNCHWGRRRGRRGTESGLISGKHR